jgi:metal-responsive CopG/Arc/MetJ family transcriptional regulator
MKAKTSITLSGEIVAEIDRIAGTKKSRSAVIEGVLRSYLRQQARARVEARDLELLNRGADRLNAEAADALDYQAPQD